MASALDLTLVSPVPQNRKTNQIREEDGVVYIALKPGVECLVDAADYPKIAGYVWYLDRDNHTDYARANAATADGRRVHIGLHRLLLSAVPSQSVDHKDGNGLDNRRSNLRFCTQSQNSANTKHTGANWRGTYFDSSKNRWKAEIVVAGKRIRLGNFKKPEDAAQAYNFAAAKYFGEFARFNEAEQTCPFVMGV